MGLFNLFKSQFKKPVIETVNEICNAYVNAYTKSANSKESFKVMANEVLKQLREHNIKNFASIEETYPMLSGKDYSQLSIKHSENKKFLENYIVNMMLYIRPDLYGTDAGSNVTIMQSKERLKSMINLYVEDLTPSSINHETEIQIKELIYAFNRSMIKGNNFITSIRYAIELGQDNNYGSLSNLDPVIYFEKHEDKINDVLDNNLNESTVKNLVVYLFINLIQETITKNAKAEEIEKVILENIY